MRTSSVWSHGLPTHPVATWWFTVHWSVTLVAFAGLVAGAPTRSQAADPPPPAQSSDHERIQQLEDEVKRLKKDERQLKVNVENQKPLAGWTDGFNLSSADGRYKLRIGGYSQADGRFFIDDSSHNNTTQFLLRRVRLILEGTVFKYFDFRVAPDFAPSPPQLFDAYLDVTYLSQAKLRIGKFRPPVGLERLQSATALRLVERGQPTNLVPNRDNGLQLFGEQFDGVLSYQFGIFNGVPDNLNPSGGDVNDDKDFAGRVFIAPFKSTSIDALKGLGVGVAGTTGNQGGNASNPDLPTYKTFGQATFFQYSGANASSTLPRGPTIANGERSRVSPQTYYSWGPFGLLGEYVAELQNVSRDNKSAGLHNNAWQVAASYVLTGEAASYKGVVPAQPFNPFEGKWGAVEVAGRYGQLVVDSDAFSQGFANPSTSARRDKEWVVGVNWYLNKNIKFVLDYANSDFKGGAPKGGDRASEYAIVSRVQLAF